MGSHAAPRLKSFGYQGVQAYSITCCTFDKRPCFSAPAAVELARLQLLRTAAEREFSIPAYCFMPDHAHLLLSGTSTTSDLRKFMNRWKQRTGFAYSRETGRLLWQAGYYDHVLRCDEDLVQVARYIIANPVRAGLVTDPDEYPFWGSTMWTRIDLLEFFRAGDRCRGHRHGRDR
jgi:putative transposase